MEKLISVQEAAKILGVSKVAVIKQINAGKLKAVKVGNTFVIDRDEFTVIGDRDVSDGQKHSIEKAVQKTIADYGETLRLLKDA